MAKRVLIVGCGVSGLTAMKCCVDEGLTPVCLERTDEVGGLWNYKEEVRDDQACVMKNTIINTSKEMMAFSDFPMKAELPNYLHNSQIMDYFKDYMDKFKLCQYINYNKEALMVKPAEDFDSSGRWDVEIKDRKTGKTEQEKFDAVIVCTGHHAKKNIPTFPGQDEFQGQMMHSQDYKHAKGWEDKRVVVIGMGNSSVDTANDLSRVARKVFISTRRGTWLVPRNMDNGLPFDVARTTRLNNWLAHTLPESFIAGQIESELNKMYDHEMYGFQAAHRFTAQHPNMSSDLPMNISTGRIVMKGDIKRLTKTGVEFSDGTFEDNIDLVVMATGYKFGFPFVDKSVVDVQNNRVELYKYVFPPNLKKQTFAILGCVQPVGAIMPVSELQCRIATRVFKGLIKLPSKMAMLTDIRHKEDAMRCRYVDSTRHTIQVDFVDYMDQLASILGCKPNLWKYIMTDPKLAMTCFFGPCTPFQYRLQGPGSWSGARDAVVNSMKRVKQPFKTRPLPGQVHKGPLWTSAIFIFIYIIFLAVLVKYLLL